MRDTTKFRQGLEYLNITVTDRMIEQFMMYYEMLIEKNKVMNLTAITEFDEVIEKHFIDSLMVARVQPLGAPLYIIDLGTGAGFPGIPLKIAFPQLNIVLADSLNKRIKFLEEVIDALELNGSTANNSFSNADPQENIGTITAVHGRAEDLGRQPLFREQFDLCVSRAVANLATLSEYCMPFVKVGGAFIPYKSGNVDEELAQSNNAIKILGGSVDKYEKMVLPGTDISRSFIVIRKTAPIKKKYPRKAGTPGKEPLS